MTTALASKEGVGILAATHTIPGAAVVTALAGASVAAFAAVTGRNSAGQGQTPYLVVDSEEGQYYEALPEDPRSMAQMALRIGLLFLLVSKSQCNTSTKMVTFLCVRTQAKRAGWVDLGAVQ